MSDLLEHAGWLTGNEAQQALSLAQQAHFFEAEAQVQHLAGNHEEALHGYLRISAAAAFGYLETALNASNMSPTELSSIWAAIKATLPGLVEADGPAFARLVVASFPEEHEDIVASLNASPKLQFRFALYVEIYIVFNFATLSVMPKQHSYQTSKF